MMAVRPGIEMERTREQQEPIEPRAAKPAAARLRLEELETRAAPTPSIPIPPPFRWR
jgi:hypothetical protein